ncbi:MAG: UPF0236 family protein [Actinobacteria bacterium]|nr:UPF0236 family protein [Actinomycetota bacterium]
MKSIELCLGKVKLRLENFSLNHIERQAVDLRQEIFEKIIKDIFTGIERLVIERARCSCGSKLLKDGKDRRIVVTIGGKVSYARSRMICKACGKNYYPLDDAIGLANGAKHSLRATEVVLDMVTDLPYAKTSRHMDKLAHIQVSPQKIAGIVSTEGAKLLGQDEEQRVAAFDKSATFPAEIAKKSLAIVQVDSTGINDRYTKSWMDTKVGIIYSQSARLSKTRNLILDKNVYASLDGVEKFRQNFYLSCHKMGVFSADKVIFVSDGIPWIKKLAKEMFPKAIYLLDLWHLKKNINLAYGKENAELVDNLAELAYYGEAAALLKNVGLDIARCRDPDRSGKLKDLFKYIRSNADGIENYKKVGILGSGAVEKTVDILVARRFKLRGMSWYEKNAAKMLRLRLLKINGEWDNYWNKRFEDNLSRNFRC